MAKNNKKNKKNKNQLKNTICKKQTGKEFDNISIKSYLKKIFTSQKVAVYFAVVGCIIAYFAYDNQKENAIKEEKEREKNRIEKEFERKNNEHDFLILKWNCFELKSGKYNVDFLLLDEKDDPHFIFFGVDIYNGGNKSAKKTKLEIFSPEGIEIASIFKMPYATDTILTENRNFGIISFDDFIPGLHMGTSALFAQKNLSRFKSGQNMDFQYRLYCEDKARPVILDFNITLFKFSSIQDYYTYIVKNKFIYGDHREYFKKKDFLIIREKVNGSTRKKYYKVEIDSNDDLVRTECNDQNQT